MIAYRVTILRHCDVTVELIIATPLNAGTYKDIISKIV